MYPSYTAMHLRIRRSLGSASGRRGHVRAWIVHVRDTSSSGTARSWFAGLRHFARWMLAEDEIGHDFTEGIKTPKPQRPQDTDPVAR